MSARILVAGVGNIFLGDDAFGVEVIRTLAKHLDTDDVSVRDFGIRGFDLAYALLDPWEAVIIVDALPRGEAPGTLFTLQPNLNHPKHPTAPDMAINPHGMDPVRVLNLAASIGAISAQIIVVGCEPNDFGDELQGRMGLSTPVQAAVEEAASMVEGLVGRILAAKSLHPTHSESMEVMS